MPEDITTALIETLRRRALERNSAVPATWDRPDAMAWTALGLAAHGVDPELTEQLRRGLAERQLPDGRIPLSPQTPRAVWPTSMTLLAWREDPALAEPRGKAKEFLLTHRGTSIEGLSDVVGHDATLQGWPWIDETHSWVEPTALALLALTGEGLATHPAVREGVAVLRDRELPDGGWNYGNPKIYGSVLLPMPECTGIALCALRNEMSGDEAADSLAYLESEYPGLRTPLSLSWTIMGLSAFGRRPADVESKVAESFALQERYGPFESTLIGLLAACLAEDPFSLPGGAA
ncbi:hypothetical protein GM415_09220 [Pseudodesulfovibrio cashew]|uniref:Prenyltransferase n=1 Tax=Pseudodesulfovibrio cashew TaxID=2678688 RepID=A0A6I6JBZ5_9BACT|nr:hypothetical protein [Pseudodesulfovibrio cashew]QGY40296.1 hypothetical protein GM415_09220 [Pseudodesulfovibrio cashew]